MLLPRIVAYDKLGAPIASQDKVEIISSSREEELDWEDWAGLKQVKNAYLKETAKTAVATAASELYLKEQPTHSFKLVRAKGQV